VKTASSPFLFPPSTSDAAEKNGKEKRKKEEEPGKGKKKKKKKEEKRDTLYRNHCPPSLAHVPGSVPQDLAGRGGKGGKKRKVVCGEKKKKKKRERTTKPTTEERGKGGRGKGVWKRKIQEISFSLVLQQKKGGEKGKGKILGGRKKRGGGGEKNVVRYRVSTCLR